MNDAKKYKIPEKLRGNMKTDWIMGIRCPYCADIPLLTSPDENYPWGHRYLCYTCGAYCGVHKSNLSPLGRLADHALRKKRSEAHFHFDRLWKNQRMSRSKAYEFLSLAMGVPKGLCHIGYFDEHLCDKVVTICKSRSSG